MKRLMLLLAMLLYLGTNSSFTQWVQVNSGMNNTDLHLHQGIIVSPAIDCANVYAGPSETETIKACVPAGTSGSLMSGPSGSFWAVAFSNGVQGWCAREDLVHPLPSAIYSFAVLGTNLFAGTSDGVFRSTDNGAAWIPVDGGLLVPYTDYWYIHALAASGTNLFAGTVYGVYCSADSGAQWGTANGGLKDYTPIHSLATIGSNLFAGSTVSGTLYRSTDNGGNWTATGLTGNVVNGFAASCTYLFAATSGGGVFRSTDSGINWVAGNDGMTDPVVNSLAVIGATLFAGTGENGVYLSTDHGLHWTPANADLPGSCPVTSLAAFGTNLFAGTPNGVFCSSDNGTRWTEWNSGLGDINVQALIVSGTDLLAGTGHGIWRQALSDPLPIQLASFKATPLSGHGVALTWSTLSETNNYGFHVQRDGADITFIAGHGTTIDRYTYSYTDNPSPGLHQYTLKQVDLDGSVTLSETVVIDVIVNTKFSLNQNYPNPFNPSTQIKFAITKEGPVTLRVYDILGREVATLVNESRKPGEYKERFDGTRLASGFYMYILRNGEGRLTGRMVLSK